MYGAPVFQVINRLHDEIIIVYKKRGEIRRPNTHPKVIEYSLLILSLYYLFSNPIDALPRSVSKIELVKRCILLSSSSTVIIVIFVDSPKSLA